MAKAKKENAVEIKAEEVMVEPTEEKAEEPVKEDYTEKFISIQLGVINRMPDRAKAQRLAKRILRNRKG